MYQLYIKSLIVVTLYVHCPLNGSPFNIIIIIIELHRIGEIVTILTGWTDFVS